MPKPIRLDFEIRSHDDLMEALDALHTLAMDGLGDDAPALNAIEQAMSLLSEAMIYNDDDGEDA